MKKFIQTCVLALGMAVLSAGVVQAEGEAGAAGYVSVVAPQPTSDASKIEVVEMFWYGCSHCYHLEPLLSKWVSGIPSDVVFVRMPAILGPSWEILARGYYTAELLGVLDKIHAPLFNAIHEGKQKINNEDDLAKFFVAQGIDEKQFRDTIKSFGVAAKLNRSKQMTQRYGITGVPSLIVNGKYRTSAGDAGGQEQMLVVVDKLIAEERAAKTTAAK
ncbi:MAG: thiol:disulfide interchange protein DsbA/DsbL [Gammaproteobacteria bacterium]|nr:thiol:disulfide interchange protein DsbA/DsbL [Gammaproteobacteria bacterium]